LGAVNASGFADCSGLPDTFAGLFQCLVKMRNTYAPNVLIASDHSLWGFWGQDDGPNCDGVDPCHFVTPTQAGTNLANWVTSFGASGKPDLVFYQTEDADAQCRALTDGTSSCSFWGSSCTWNGSEAAYGGTCAGRWWWAGSHQGAGKGLANLETEATTFYSLTHIPGLLWAV
jgi:hypothetical protein